MEWCCGVICRAAAESKRESIWDIKWKPADRRTGGGAEWIRTRKAKQGNSSKSRTGFCLREWGIGDECGKVPVPVWRSEEFVNGEIQLGVRRKENVGDVVEGHEFHNIISQCSQLIHCPALTVTRVDRLATGSRILTLREVLTKRHNILKIRLELEQETRGLSHNFRQVVDSQD